MKSIFGHILFVFISLLGGCVMLSSSEVSVKETIQLEKGEKRVTFLNNTPYLADMSIAFSEYGFEVMPMPTQELIYEIRNNRQLSKYNEAVTRWGLTLSTRNSGMTCAFTDFNIHHFTLMLTDITNNKVVMVLKQKGSDGPCTTVKPVFDTLAEKLAGRW
jgi:hypothetical protein